MKFLAAEKKMPRIHSDIRGPQAICKRKMQVIAVQVHYLRKTHKPRKTV